MITKETGDRRQETGGNRMLRGISQVPGLCIEADAGD